MNRYVSDECAVCKVTFKDGDDIVVCPYCGTPHHRACYSKETGCANIHWHGIKNYEDEKRKQREETAKKCEDTSVLKCGRCGAQNPSTGLFCQVCGNSLHKKTTNNNQDPFSFTPPPINPIPFTTPFGGVSPDEDIDGISAKELAVFVGDNSFYFIPKMKQLHNEEKIVSWNWSAFLLDFYYFFYRKMYLVGKLVLILSIDASIHALLYTFGTMGYNDFSLLPDNLVRMGNIANICSMLFWGVRILCGLFANYIYTQTAFKRIKNIREKLKVFDNTNSEYVNELAKKGRTSHKAVLIICIVQVILPYALAFFMI